jgi:selenocysteine lyase/cysteine desulfurase
MYKSFYSRFLSAKTPEGLPRLHFAAHSHHLWPDVTRDAVLQYWDDSARLCDDKWRLLFSEVIPRAQKNVAETLSCSRPENVVFAPNTHELVERLLSCFNPYQGLRVLTTDSEFQTLERQLSRLQELPNVKVTRVATEPFETFSARFQSELQSTAYDFVYLSHVFYNSGFCVDDLEEIVDSVRNRRPGTDSVFVIDGYHSFFSIPTSLQRIEDRVFYLAGGYKYGQSGDSVCFMTVPRECSLRPLNTGWFPSFGPVGEFSQLNGPVDFSNDGYRFFGATFDPSGLYRFNAVAQLLKSHGLHVKKIDAYLRELQELFIQELATRRLRILSPNDLLTGLDLQKAGHFLTFRRSDVSTLSSRLKERGVITDTRGNRIRFGFGLYQDASDVHALIEHLEQIQKLQKLAAPSE